MSDETSPEAAPAASPDPAPAEAAPAPVEQPMQMVERPGVDVHEYSDTSIEHLRTLNLDNS